MYTNQYTLETCMAVFCSANDMATGTLCSTCQQNIYPQSKCDVYSDATGCGSERYYGISGVCQWDGGSNQCKSQYFVINTEPINTCYGCITGLAGGEPSHGRGEIQPLGKLH